MSALAELEQRVGEKWVAAAAKRAPHIDFDLSQWAEAFDHTDLPVGTPLPPLPPGTLQFPREQWVSYPNKRTVTLLTRERLLDFDELTDYQWMTLCLLMQYGGKTRIA